MWPTFIYKLQRYFSSGWSRWVDMHYIIRINYGFMGLYRLELIQMKINSKSGKKKFNNLFIAKGDDKDSLIKLASNINPRLKIRYNES